MDTTETDRLVNDYLRRLDHAAAHLERARRAELVAEIRGHIDAALRQEEAAGEAAVRNVLDRLGPPGDIVEAAQPQTPVVDHRAGKLDIGALIALIVPFIGWLVGAVLVSVSQVWSRRDKLIAALLLLLPIVLVGLSFLLGSPHGSEESLPPGDARPAGEKVEAPLEPGAAGVVLLIAGVPSALYLGWRLRPGSAMSHTASPVEADDVTTMVRVLRVLLILVLALVAVSFVIGIANSTTGAVEKVVLSALIAGCIVVAAQVSKFTTRRREGLQRH